MGMSASSIDDKKAKGQREEKTTRSKSYSCSVKKGSPSKGKEKKTNTERRALPKARKHS